MRKSEIKTEKKLEVIRLFNTLHNNRSKDIAAITNISIFQVNKILTIEHRKFKAKYI